MIADRSLRMSCILGYVLLENWKLSLISRSLAFSDTLINIITLGE